MSHAIKIWAVVRHKEPPFSQVFLGSETENDALFTVPSPEERWCFLVCLKEIFTKKTLKQVRLKDSNMTQDERSWMIEKKGHQKCSIMEIILHMRYIRMKFPKLGY